jgi:hypothetical protein
MSAFGGPNIIEDGLVLYLDAGNRKSYPGSGTTWLDKSGRGNNGTLINGPTFNSSNGGSIVFDGTNDYITFPSVTLNTNTGFTIDMWIYINDPQPVYSNFWSYWLNIGGNGGFEWGVYANTGLQGIFLVKDAGASGGPTVISSYVGNQWANIIFGCNSTIPFIYTNGTLSGTANNFRNINITITEILRGSSRYFKANQASIKFYNRALTASEVLQNYNATKGRFNL